MPTQIFFSVTYTQRSSPYTSKQPIPACLTNIVVIVIVHFERALSGLERPVSNPKAWFEMVTLGS
jgi:hypothetical protein